MVITGTSKPYNRVPFDLPDASLTSVKSLSVPPVELAQVGLVERAHTLVPNDYSLTSGSQGRFSVRIGSLALASRVI